MRAFHPNSSFSCITGVHFSDILAQVKHLQCYLRGYVCRMAESKEIFIKVNGEEN